MCCRVRPSAFAFSGAWPRSIELWQAPCHRPYPVLPKCHITLSVTLSRGDGLQRHQHVFVCNDVLPSSIPRPFVPVRAGNGAGFDCLWLNRSWVTQQDVSLQPLDCPGPAVTQGGSGRTFLLEKLWLASHFSPGNRNNQGLEAKAAQLLWKKPITNILDVFYCCWFVCSTCGWTDLVRHLLEMQQGLPASRFCNPQLHPCCKIGDNESTWLSTSYTLALCGTSPATLFQEEPVDRASPKS